MLMWQLKVAVGLLLISGVILSCEGAVVQLFKDADFKGERFQFNSSQTCTMLPERFRNSKGSIKTAGCVVVYKSSTCSREELNTNLNLIFRGDGHIIRSEVARLSQLNHRNPTQEFYVNSFKDCGDIETNPTTDFDFYEDYIFREKMVQVKNICGCTNLPVSTFRNTWFRSANTYGNCFRIYNTADCRGQQYFTTNVVWIDQLRVRFLSIEPCTLSPSCRSYSATNLTFELLPTTSNLPYSAQQVSVVTNNWTTPVEENNDAMMEIAQFEVPSQFSQFESITFVGPNDVDLETDSLFPPNSSPELQSAIALSFRELRSNWNETIKNGLQTEMEFRAQDEIFKIRCPANQVKVEMTEREIPYRVQLKISGTLPGGIRLEASTIRSELKAFTYLTSTEQFDVMAETTIKLKLKYGEKIWANFTEMQIEECRRRVKMTARIVSLQPVLGAANISDLIQRHAITTKQIIVNNVSTPQEDDYEGTGEIKDTAKFQVSKEMSQFTSLSFKNGLKHGLQIVNPFIATMWKEFQIELPKMYKNGLDKQEPIVFEIEREIDHRVQRKILVAPCTAYEISSYVDVAENVKINYLVRLEVTGQLEHEPVDADELQDILKDMNMTVFENIDNFTVIAETTAMLTLTTGVSSGVDSSESSIVDCKSHFLQFSGTIVKLEELVTNNSNSADSDQHVTVAPRIVFINNSTTTQEDVYEEVTEITDSVSFEFPKEFSQIGLLKFDQRARTKMEKSVPFLMSIWTKLKSGLMANRANWNETVTYDVKNTKEIGFKKTIDQARCMRYEVSSFIEIKENVEVNYRVLMEVTAKFGNDEVKADEFRKNLKQLNFVHDKDDFTSTVETTMKLKLNYGHGSGVDVAGTHMLDCLEREAAFVANCKFSCSR